MANRLERQTLDLLAGDSRNEIKVPVNVENPPAINFCACRHQKICDRCGSVGAVGEKFQLNLPGAIFDSRCHVVLDQVAQEPII